MYKGSYANGLKKGLGTFTWASGDQYVGEFYNDKFHGQGTYSYENGNIFKLFFCL